MKIQLLPIAAVVFLSSSSLAFELSDKAWCEVKALFQPAMELMTCNTAHDAPLWDTFDDLLEDTAYGYERH